MRNVSHVILIGMLAVSGAACFHRHSSHVSAGDVAPMPVSVRVENQNIADVDVYFVSQGISTRLGTVPGASKGVFTVEPSRIITGQLRLVARQIGGAGRAASGALNIAPGQTVLFTITPVMRQSTAVVQ